MTQAGGAALLWSAAFTGAATATGTFWAARSTALSVELRGAASIVRVEQSAEVNFRPAAYAGLVHAF